ncbi:Alkaline phosphatase [Arcticibacter svalbardensis MN12-7]|uniref:Alkaline phosphatase n=1 Tax=Arcticibacter svalbardensis MN12-7 TaxID=1150600 RepID=R9GUF9_9SPHI|nr:alkaline phosphatase PafA [Arcticibacter svalbardensis]EOR92554.1 Alkaline phosphatase [Arcticibacter svalbardensis MN12-7]
MKLSYLFGTAFILLTIGASAQKKSTSSSIERPKLVVGIVVDQMRWDYLYRYQERYSKNGFKRLLQEGFSCENTNIDYIPTVTAIGHSTIYTGSVPSLHGIAGNDFIVQATGKSMYCTDDSTAKTVGSTSSAGEMSPNNLLVTTVTDELKLATNFRAKTIGIAIKDRGGILPGGHAANAAYWFDDLTGNWITSTYYMKDLPTWVKTVNAQKLAQKYLDKNWNTLYPINTYVQSEKDDSPFEGKFPGVNAPVFPYETSTMYKKDFSAIRATPYGNSITLDMAKSTIDNEQMGQGDVPDFLAVSLSSTDYVGHQFGPNSIEIEDTYLRLDQDIASFLTYLDNKVGKGNYTVFLSADHGAAHNPNFLLSHHIPAGLFPSSVVTKDLNALLEKEFKQPNLVLGLPNYQVNLNNLVMEKNKLDESAIIKTCIEYLNKRSDVAYVVEMEKASQASVPEQLKTRIINGYNKERSGAIQIVLKPGFYSGGATGTTHGTWNPYDAHIPFVLMGWGIKHGATNRPVAMTDIAPTISALLHIQAPNGNIGKPVTEALISESK